MSAAGSVYFQSPPLSKAVWLSVGAHILLLLIFTVRATLFPGEAMVIENAVRVDLVALPDKLPPADAQQPPKPVKEKPVEVKPQPPPVKEDAISLEKDHKKELSAMKKIKQMEALYRIKNKFELEKKMQAAAAFKGNQLSSGTELKGLSQQQHDNYVASVKKHIYENWSLPEWLAQKDLQAKILVRFDDRGNVIFKQIVKSSGNPAFDDAIMETVQKSSPVPAPPDKFIKILANEGVLVGFPQ